eukprot:TRINITY_DN22507_c0_g1_i1.p1 TRINITY_DN22507_c0_g1~~TRINITY_DN22507_c0_g1_i1.p1  ORF type:complete len:464 (-),score=57.31 TRINITY_DN22507_c0_g1_i1:143-1534(-)
MQVDATDIPLVVFGAHMICVNLYILLTSINMQYVSQVVGRSFQSFQCLGGARQYSKIDELVDSHVQRRREDHLHVLCTFLTCIFSLALGYNIFNILSGADRVLSQAQSALSLLMYFMASLLRVRKFQARGVCASVMCFLLLTLSSVTLFFSRDSISDLFACYTWTFIIRSLASACCVNGVVALVGNIFCMLVNAWTIMTMESIDEATVFVVMRAEVVCSACVVALGFCYHHIALADAHREVDATTQKIEKSAVTSLLDAVCDVSMTLDDSFRFEDHSERFAAMLMLPASRSLRAVDIRDFMPVEGDKARFRTQLSRSSSGGTLSASALNVSMRDSSRSDLQVEILCVPFAAIDDATRYMVGIREVVDRPQMARMPIPLDASSELPERAPSALSETSGSLRAISETSERMPAARHAPLRGTPPIVQGSRQGAEHSQRSGTLHHSGTDHHAVFSEAKVGEFQVSL